MTLKFDSGQHIYSFDGVVIPSVTQVLPEMQFYCTPERLEETRQEGEESHSMIKMFFDAGSQETFGDPMLEDLKKWLDENRSVVGEVVLYEKSLFSGKNRFAGSPDCIFQKAVVDFKRSRGDAKRHALQLAGYHLLSQENKIAPKTKNWLIVYRTKTGFRCMNVYDEEAEKVFLLLVKGYWIDRAVQSYFKN